MQIALSEVENLPWSGRTYAMLREMNMWMRSWIWYCWTLFCWHLGGYGELVAKTRKVFTLMRGESLRELEQILFDNDGPKIIGNCRKPLMSSIVTSQPPAMNISLMWGYISKTVVGFPITLILLSFCKKKTKCWSWIKKQLSLYLYSF